MYRGNFGYVLHPDTDEVKDNLEKSCLVPVKETNYVNVEPKVIDDLVHDSDKEAATISEDEGEIKSPIKSVQDDVTHPVKLPKENMFSSKKLTV